MPLPGIPIAFLCFGVSGPGENMRRDDMGNLAVKDKAYDFVTTYTRLTAAAAEEAAPTPSDSALTAEKLKSRLQADRSILEQARQKYLENDAALDFDLNDLKTFQFAVRTLEAADSTKKVCYILQSATVKIVVEAAHHGEFSIETYQRGRCRRISTKAKSALNDFLMEKSLLIREPREESPEEDASPAAMMTQATSAMQNWNSIVENREELQLECAEPAPTQDADAASVMLATHEEMESYGEEFEIPEKNEREIGLKIVSIVAKLSSSYSVEDIRDGLKSLSAYENKIPGVTSGVAVPAFEDACIASYKRILTNKHGFIDDLDGELLKLAVEGGVDADQAKREMADRALELFVNGLSAQSGKPLKKSRAEKIRTFAEVCGKGALMKSRHFFQAKSVVNDIFIHETQKTPKPQRDREMCKLYTELNVWVGNELS